MLWQESIPAHSRAAGKAGGFTLVEILIALVIFSILMTMAYRGISTMVDAYQSLQASNQRWRDVSSLMGRWEEDFAQVSNRSWRDQAGVRHPAVRGGATPLPDTQTQLELVRFQGDQLVHLGYRLREGQLEMLLWNVLDQAPRTEPVVLPLLSGVSTFTVGFWSRSSSSQAQANWNPPPGDRLPLAVNIRIELENGDIVQRLYALP